MKRHGRTTKALLACTLLGGALTVAVAPVAPIASAAPPDDLFFSEYVEGSSLNKALEIYNGTGSPIDLGADGYNVAVFFNGNTTANTTIELSGVITDEDVFVVADDGASAEILAVTDQTTTSSLFNGDDAILLRRGTTVVDSIGQVGFDPGSQWGTGDVSTADNTLRRMEAVCAGDTDATDVFDPAAEWNGFANNTVDGLGAHSATCSSEPATPVINEFVANHTGTDTAEFVEIFGDATADLGVYTLLEIEGDSSGTATGVVDGAWTVGSTDAAGFWTTGFLNNEIENGTVTLLLVRDFSGSVGDDLDTADDGMLDSEPWTAIVDAVGVSDGGAADIVYGMPTLTSSFDGGGFTVGGASRIPDGTDTETTDDWVRNDFNGDGLPGFTSTTAVGQAVNTPGATNVEIEPIPGGECGDPVVLVHQIQGSGATFDPAFGGVQSVEAVVTALAPGLDGLYVQEEAGDQDADPATSEGIFVFLDEDPAVALAVGDVVRVTGTVGEFVSSGGASSQTQLTGGPIVTSCGATDTVPATDVLFPTDPGDLEAVEGMRVTLSQELAISEYFNFDRFNEVVVALPLDGDDRPFNPTSVVAPGPAAIERAAENASRRITIDDVRSSQNPDPAIHPGNGEEFTLENRFRGGDTITGIEGVVDDTFGIYRIQPTTYGDFGAMNPRPAEPEDVGGDTTVASMNVLNYFLTIDDGPDVCGPAQNQDCRGADSAAEFDRQRVKIVAALAGLDSDIVGLIELENTTGVEPVDDLVNGPDGLNDLFGAGTYEVIETGTIGTDAIRVGMIYRPDAVTPVGDPAILDSSVDPRFLDGFNRPVLAQAFEAPSGRRFTVAVNHLKSKGSDCDAVGDPDAGDGQGNCNETRTAAAEALADWLATDPTGSGTSDSLIIGDLNAYDKEDPISALVDAGYTDLVAQFGGENAYSYVFSAEFGYLDHALASSGLAAAVTGATEWHINADEPDILDYNLDFKQPAQQALFEPNAFRSSDHDPVVLGLDLTAPSIDVAVTPAVLSPPNHKYVEVEAMIVLSDETDPDPAVRLVSVTSNEPDNGIGDGNTVDDIVIVDDDSFRLRAERSGAGQGRIYTITYEAMDAAGNTAVGVAIVEVPR